MFSLWKLKQNNKSGNKKLHLVEFDRTTSGSVNPTLYLLNLNYRTKRWHIGKLTMADFLKDLVYTGRMWSMRREISYMLFTFCCLCTVYFWVRFNFLIYLLPPANWVAKVRFSYVSVHQSVCLSTEGAPCAHYP